MATTSGSYSFGQTISDQLITDAYERVTVVPDTLTGNQIISAQRSINLMLSEWMNRGLNLWTLSPTLLGLTTNQYAYSLPENTCDILSAYIRTSSRQLGGTPFSSEGGVAANAFDGNPATKCTQTAPNGYISYDYGAGNLVTINMFGVQPAANSTYDLVFEYSFDNATWQVAENVISQLYPVDKILWFNVPVPIPARAFRIRETGGATLNIEELYFNNNINDIQISSISATEYAALPQKNQTGRPSSFWFNRQITPAIYLWPAPTNQYTTLYYLRTVMLQDVGQLTNLVEIPQRFYEALTSELAYRLAIKNTTTPNDRVLMLQSFAQKSFDLAASSDTENSPLRVSGDYSSGWGR